MSHRVLVIDHRPQALQRVVDPLREAGYEVVAAQSAADGATAFGRFQPDLVFIAAELPRTEGTVLCRELKGTDAGSRSSIVLIVESVSIEIDLPALDQFGADRLIQKSVSNDELVALCRELVDGVPTPGTAVEAATTDDGLTAALDGLESVELEAAQTDQVGPRDGATPSPDVVPLSGDRGRDIEEHIDHLFGAAPTPEPSTEPSTGRDTDADATLTEDLDITDGFFKALEKPETPAPVSTEGPTTTQPLPPAPPAPSATSTVHEPVPGTEQVVGRFQTEVITRKPTMPPPTTGSKRRWLWAAIPAIVGVIAFAVFLVNRAPVDRPRDTGAEKPPVTDAVHAGVDFDPSAASFGETSPVGDEEEILGEFIATETPQPVEPIPVPVSDEEPPVRRVAEVVRTPIVRKKKPIPEPEPEPVAPRETVVAQAPVARPKPRPEPIETPAITVQESEPAVPVDPIPQPETIFEPAPVEPEPVLREPITRNPILMQREEPRVSEKDLKKADGTVILRVRVNSSGRVTRVLVDQGMPGSPVEAAAVAAVLRWQYEPALDRDEPIEAWTTARFTFGD